MNTSCPIIIERTWTVFDTCLNTRNCVQTITIQDTIAPTITCPADIEADACTLADVGGVAGGYGFSTDSVTLTEVEFEGLDGVSDAADNCGVLEVTYWDNVVNTSCPIIIERTWTVFDTCLNTRNCVQTITIQDTIAPTITCPADIEADACTLADVGGVAGGYGFSTDSVTLTEVEFEGLVGVSDAADNCGVLEVTYWDNVVNTSCPIIIERTWTVFDTCLNTRNCVQTITIQDTIAPTITCPADIEADACTLADVGGVAGGYGFSTDSVTLTEVEFEGLDGVSDAADNCGVLEVTYWDNVVNTSCPIIIERTWTVFDTCLNTRNCVQTITIQDTIAPTITCPADIEADACTLADVGGVAGGYGFSTDSVTLTEVEFEGLDGVSDAADNCGVLEVTYWDNVVNTSCPIIIERTWTVFDTCLNTRNCVQTITIQDTIAPTITCPADIEADACTLADVGGVAGGYGFSTDSVTLTEVEFEGLDGVSDAADNCGVLAVTYWDNVVNTSCPIIIERTWTVFDTCLNTRNCVQTITIQDTIAPTITCPADIEADACTLADVGGVAGGYGFSTDSVTLTEVEFEGLDGVSDAADNCGVLEVTYWDNVVNTSCPIIIERTWTVFDTCLNTRNCVQTITIQDTIAPTITCPADIEADACTLADVGGVAGGYGFSTDSVTLTEVEFEGLDGVSDAADNCGVLEVTYWDNVVNTSCPIIIERTWTVFDTCLNTRNCVQTITIQDTIAPTITCPADIEADACTLADVGGVAGGYGFSTDSVTLTEVEFEGLDGVSDAADNCGVLAVTYWDNVVNTSCPIIIERTWTVFDTCLNTRNCVQTITIQDTIAPTITCPADIEADACTLADVGGVAGGYGFSTDSVTLTEVEFEGLDGVSDAADNCGVLEVTYWDNVVNTSCPIIIERTWTVFDTCLNTRNCVQTITIQDTIAPTITCPADIEADACTLADVGGVAGGYGFSTDSVTLTEVEFEGLDGVSDAADNCGVLEVTYWDNVVNTSCPIIIERTWTVFDTCLNTRNCVQTITIQDTIAPTITCPADIEADACTLADVGGVAGGYGFSTDSVTLTEVEFEGLDGVSDAADNCGVLEVTYWDNVVNTSCPIIIERTWTVFDTCLNTRNCVQTITIQDTIAPTITCPADIEADACTLADVGGVAGGYGFSTDSVTLTEVEFEGLDGVSDAADNCGVLEVTYWDNVVNTSCPIIIERTWTVFDTCLNTRNCVQTITIQDTIAPTITCPADIEADACTLADVGGVAGGYGFSTDSVTLTEVEFEGLDGVSDAADNCGVLEVTYWDNVVNTSCPIIIERTWTVFDTCLNTRNCVQTITIQDTIAPTITCPADIEADACTLADVGGVAGGYGFSTDSVTLTEVEFEGLDGVSDAADNCGVLEVTYWDNVVNTSCPIIVERTWTVIDSCSNTSNCVQTITIQDTIVPIITCPANIAQDGCGPADLATITGWAFDVDSVDLTPANLTCWMGRVVRQTIVACSDHIL